MRSLQDNYSVNLDVFQGPLDLLHYLISKDEIDIYDIPIARVAEQYMHYIEMMKVLNLELAGEYILMAATLIRIKAKMLLPRDEESEEELDPREELVAALLEYRKFREAGDILKDKRFLEERLFVPSGINTGIEHKEKIVYADNATLFDLLTAFKETLDRINEEQLYEIAPEELSVEDRIERILSMLSQSESATFQQLFADIPRKIVAVTTLLAILELVKLKRIKIRQSLPFSELRVYRGQEFDNEQSVLEQLERSQTL
ncbi:MAG: segregation/condensation protein A [candidate division Zixibacteria bacterium]|nr:segregation/condensation protein A [candidate division Zixibacteria bacterium]